MWISDKYYQELLKVLQGFSNGCFDFDEYELLSFSSSKYKQITDILKQIKVNQKRKINDVTELMDFIIDGSYASVESKDIKLDDYKIFYQKYNDLVKHLEKINRHINTLQKTIIKNGKIDARINDSELNG